MSRVRPTISTTGCPTRDLARRRCVARALRSRRRVDRDRKRLTRRVTDLFAAAKVTALVDHLPLVQSGWLRRRAPRPGLPSTCGMVASMLSDWDVALDPAMATHLYTGIIFDTGFKHENTMSNTRWLQLLDLGVQPAPSTRRSCRRTDCASSVRSWARPATPTARSWWASSRKKPSADGIRSGHRGHRRRAAQHCG